KSVFAAISSGAQHALDHARKAVAEAQKGIAQAREAAQNARKTIQEQVGNRLKGYVAEAKGLIGQVKGTVGQYHKQFDGYARKIEETIDKHGGKWVKAGLYIEEHGDKAYAAGNAVLGGCEQAIRKCKEKQGDEAAKDVEPLKPKFEECKTHAKLCFDKLEEVANDLPESVKTTLTSVVGRIRKMLPQGESTLQKTTDAVHARVGELAKKAKEFYQEARRNSDAA